MMQSKFYSINNHRVPGLRDYGPNGSIKCTKLDGTVTYETEKYEKYGFVRPMNRDIIEKK